MKKLSRILSRRRPDDADSDSEVIHHRRRAGTPTPRPASSGPTPTGFHQLPSRRATSSKADLARAHRELRNGVSGGCIIADGSLDAAHIRDDASAASDTSEQSARKPFVTKTCPRCAAIDFPHLLDWKQGQPRPWVALSHVLPPPSLPPSPPAENDLPKPQGPPQCPFCVFFGAMIGPIPAVREGTAKFHPYLRIRQAFERLDGVGERHELAGSVILEVMTTNKSLPWGYLLKAEELNDDGISTHRPKESEKPRIRGRLVPSLVNPSLPKSWLDFCNENHGAGGCTSRAKPIDGLRLIDCDRMCVVAADQLEKPDVVDYLTLSYAFSQTGLDTTPGVSSDISALLLSPDGRLPEILPPLFTDAIAFTTTLGFRYLWIDRLCLQLPPRERQAQIELMGDIFSGSSLTLIVASGDTTLAGIPGLSTTREDQLSLKTRTGLYTTSLIRPDLEVASSKWASRGWTLQEGLLSRRRLIFTPSQVYFQCRLLHCHESISLPLRLAPSISLGRVFPVGGACLKSADFKDLVRAYMCRHLTNNKERLDAFRPLLQEYARIDHLPVRHFLGLPLFHPDDFVTSGVVSETDRLAASLGWICDWPTPFEAPGEPSCYSTSSFPSWTWLAWNLRSGLTPADSKFAFNLVRDMSPILDGVSAAPMMEISVGFKDATVLSWEIDGDAIARKTDAITFLRLETFCFDLAFSKENGAAKLQDAALTSQDRALVEAMLTASEPNGPYCMGVLVSGRNWKNAKNCAATALICTRRSPEEHGGWVRLGAIAIECESFVASGNDAVLKMLRVDDEKGALKVQLREIDLY